MKTNKDLWDLSGHVSSSKKLVSFLYSLGRDHLPLGQIQQLILDAQNTPVSFSNGWLAQYAKTAAEALEEPKEQENLLAVIEEYNKASKLLNEKTSGKGKACRMALSAHQDQKYGELPYYVHLVEVVNVVRYFSCLLDPEGSYDVLLENAAWLHDAIEDTDVEHVTIDNEFGVITADLVWSVTGDGNTREERVRSIYRKLEDNQLGCVLKLADRIANVEQCKKNNPNMLEMYRKELPGFRDVVEPQVPKEMWERLERSFR